MVDFDVLCLFMLDNVEEWCYFVIASLHLARADECALWSGLEGRAAAAAELAMLHEVRALGHTWRLSEGACPTPSSQTVPACSNRVWPNPRDILFLAPIQLIVYERAVTRGLDLNSSRNPAMLIRRPEQEQMEGR
jgi:hypothetical protein